MLFNGPQQIFNQAQGFLVVDGVNGAGKSTLLEKISTYLEAAKVQLVTTREPGATALGKQLRPLLLASSEKLSVLAELFLFAADRAEHVSKVINPNLALNRLVLSDRYYYSTFAFQGFGRGIDLELINKITEIAIAGTRPDLALFLDLDPEEGLRRARKRNQTLTAENIDNFEAEELAFHTRLRSGFKEIARICPEPVVMLDGAESPAAVWEAAKVYLDLWLEGVTQAKGGKCSAR